MKTLIMAFIFLSSGFVYADAELRCTGLQAHGPGETQTTHFEQKTNMFMDLIFYKVNVQVMGSHISVQVDRNDDTFRATAYGEKNVGLVVEGMKVDCNIN